MTIIVFLIDTSASMSQRAYLGGRPTLLDVAKGAVETFVKVGTPRRSHRLMHVKAVTALNLYHFVKCHKFHIKFQMLRIGVVQP